MPLPIDLSFTPFTNYAGTVGPANTPGASDLNKLGAAIVNVANKPTTRVSRSDAQSFPSSFAFDGLYWNLLGINTDPAMWPYEAFPVLGAATAFSDRIVLPYPGEWEVGCKIRASFSVTQGNCQLQLVETFTSNPNVLIDQDTQLCNAVLPVALSTTGMTIIVSAADVTAGAALRAEYSQASGGVSLVMTHPFAYPAMWARWIGTGGQ